MPENENYVRIEKIREKKTEKYLNKLEEKIYKLNKYYDYDDIEYSGLRNVRDLSVLSISEDYYKPIIVKSAFNNNYIRYESKGDTILKIGEYLSMIEPYLADMIKKSR